MNRKNKSGIAACVLSAALCLSQSAAVFSNTAAAEISLSDAVETMDGIAISSDKISTNNYKNTKYNNPISSEFFCADPTAVEYEGRLYVIGTNDHEQFEVIGPEKDNTYEQIKSMIILSTDDMVNWIYHGEINVGEIAPWIANSWAPSIVSRVEEDGKTHFYLYFSNNGLGVGVIHTTDLLGEWDDPLGKPLISSSTPGLTDCPNPFDPGAVIDENGVGWLSFGAGIASDGTDYMPGSNRIVRLGKDMISLDSEIAEIPAPYHFEASELNYINGTYVYTYNNDWNDHSEQWDYDCPVPSQCSMVYMTTKTPLDPTSWEMKGEYFVNPGTAGFDYSNNHTHLHKYKGEYYLFYHTLMLKRGMGITGSYRSLNVDKINVDEETITIEKIGGTKEGPDAIQPVNPFTEQLAANLNGTADISFNTEKKSRPEVISDDVGAWFSVRSAMFTETEGSTEETPIELSLSDVDTIDYNITVMSVDQPTTVFMYPATASGVDCVGSVEVAEAGKYTISCDMGGASGMMNMGYFKVNNDAQITFTVDTILVNGKYEFDISSELTNTREWADGLRNIWNGFADGDKVYTSEYAEFRYSESAGAIELYAAESIQDTNLGNAPLLETPVAFCANVKGTGRIEVHLDSPTGTLLTSIDFDSPNVFQKVYNKEIGDVGGTRDLYFVFSDAGIVMDSWAFVPLDGENSTEETTQPTAEEPTTESSEDTTIEKAGGNGDVNCDGDVNITDVILLNKSLLAGDHLSDEGSRNADVDLDGTPTSADSLTILKYTIKLETKLPLAK